jgi:hypothetical protein
MKIRPRAIFRLFGALLALLLVVGFGAPYLSAEKYAGRLRQSLTRALGREVEFLQPVRFNLFKGPGLSVGEGRSAVAVVIHEDPSIGSEPIAYVEAMEVRPSIWSLLGGRFVVASIRLEGATINLTKSGAPSEAGRWNFLSFVNRSVMSAAPAIHVRDGRINVNFGDTKSVFYLTETDFDLSPPGSLGKGWSVSCSAKPARTDRSAQGLGSFTLKGRWFVSPERVDLDLVLDHTGLAEITALFRGQSGAVHGTVSSRLHLGGPIANIGIAGRVDVQDVHRWDLLPMGGQGWPFDIRGRLDLVAQQLDLQSNSPRNAPLPLWIRFRAADYLVQPHWAVTANWNRFPVGPILELARHMGARLPPELQLAGVMDGAIGYSGQGGVQGAVAFQDASLTIPDSLAVRFEHAALVFDGGHVRLSPAVARMADEDAAEIEADYTMGSGALDVSISTEAMKVASLRAQAAVPWLEQVRSGQWSGQLRYHREAERAGWSGHLQLQDAEVPIPGLADPLQVASAHGQIDGARVTLDHMDAQAGKLAFTGSYSYEPGAPRPHHLRLHAGALDAADLEAELRPTLSRSGIIARALGRTSVPDWLAQRAVDGNIQVDDLLLAGAHLENLRARLLWDVTRVEFDGLQAKLDRAAIAASLSVNLRGARPVYKLTGSVKGLNWQSGKLDGQGTLETSGAGLQLLTNLKSEGVFTAGGLDFGGLSGRSLSGSYSMAWAAMAPRLRLTGLNLRTEDDSYTGRGATQDDGRLLLVLTNGAKELRVSGPLDKLRVE